MNLKFKDYIFFNKNDIGSKRKLLKMYKVKKNSFAGKTISRIYDYYFGNSTNIKKEFYRYYKREFVDKLEYLTCHLNIPEDLAQKICDEKKYYVNLNWKGDQIGYSFLNDDKLKNQFWDFVGGIEYED